MPGTQTSDGQKHTVEADQREGWVKSILLIIANRIPFGNPIIT